MQIKKTNPHKHNRLASHIVEASAEFIQHESNGQSLITVTNVSLSEDNKRATVFVSVLPENKETAVLDFLKRRIGEMRNYIGKKANIGIIPFLDVKIDFGEKNRQRVDELTIESKK